MFKKYLLDTISQFHIYLNQSYTGEIDMLMTDCLNFHIIPAHIIQTNIYKKILFGSNPEQKKNKYEAIMIC